MRIVGPIIAGVVLSTMLAGCGGTHTADESPSQHPGAAQSADAQSAVTAPTSASGVPPFVPITVNMDGLRTEITPGAMGKWAADISRGDKAIVVGKCWTTAPTYIADRYFSDRSAVATILAQRPASGQAGVGWGDIRSAQVYVPWSEAKSDYACPRVRLNAGQEIYPDDFVAHIARRFILRAQGDPINPADTAAAYPLECNFARDPITNVDRGDANRITVTREDVVHGDTRWIVQAGPLTMRMSTEPGGVCVKAAA